MVIESGIVGKFRDSRDPHGEDVIQHGSLLHENPNIDFC